jgi:iron(III) transport system substrate-binding protein
MNTFSATGPKRAVGAVSLVGAAVVLSMVSGVHPASAQAWKAEWAKTVAAAEKEGVVVLNVQTNRNFRNYIQKQWPIDFPKIKLSLTTQRSGQFQARIRTERKAGKYLWDGAYAGVSSGLNLYGEGVVDPLRPEFIFPDLKDPKTFGGWENAFYDKPHKYVLSTQNYLKSPWYHTDMIPRAKVLKHGLQLLLDPAYKGKIAWVEPLRPSAGQSISLVLYNSLGESGLRKLIKDQKVVFMNSQNTMIDKMARKTYIISIGPNMQQQTAKYKKAGLNLNFNTLGNTPKDAEASTGGGGLYVFNRRPHPNAARVFVNWVLNKKNSAGIAKATGNASRRTDVAPVDPPERRAIPGAKYTITANEANRKDLRAALAVIRRLRGK